jgi:UDP-glucose 4-epimerase
MGLLLKASEAPGVSGKMYNAGNGNRYTLNQTWELLQGMEGVELPATYAPARAGDVRDSQADITTAQRDLGHAPMFTFEEGLRLTLEWYRANLLQKAASAKSYEAGGR